MPTFLSPRGTPPEQLYPYAPYVPSSSHPIIVSPGVPAEMEPWHGGSQEQWERQAFSPFALTNDNMLPKLILGIGIAVALYYIFSKRKIR